MQYCPECKRMMRKVGPELWTCHRHPEAVESVRVVKKGGGYYDVFRGDELVDTIRGEDEAQAFANAL